MKKILLSGVLLAGILNAEVIIYGAGGPAPAMKELASAFENKTGEKVIVKAGPPSSWVDKAGKEADLIFSGSTSMMDDFIKHISGLDVKNVSVLNVRPAGIIVRPNNPKNINNFSDILVPGINVMVVNGGGQVGLYEDMALKTGNRDNLEKLRKNIKVYAKNSKVAVETWQADPSIDALIIWPHWAKILDEKEALFIKLGKEAVVYRSTEIIPTPKGLKNPQALEFVKFAQSKEVQNIWKKHTWRARTFDHKGKK